LQAADAPTSGTTNVSADGVPVVLDKFKTVDVEIGDLFSAQSRPDVMQNVTRAAGIALAEAVESDLLALYASAGSSVGTAGTDVTAAVLRQARQKLVEAKAPQLEDKFVVLSPKDYAAILGDSNITNALNYGGADAVREGRVPSVYGLQILESQLVPVVTGTPNTTYNLAFTRDFAVLATRPLPAPLDNTPSAVVMDDETQLSFRLTLQYSNTAKKHVLSVDLLYGVKAIRAGLGVQVLG
ncbi:P22 phage major capsid protein family protein, partial [Oceanithermus desulfurans]